MFDNLVWSFKSHRELYEENLRLREKILSCTSQYENTIREKNQEILLRDQKLLDLEDQLAKKPVVFDLKDMDAFFQDLPYDGSIPDGAWLTPGPNDRTER